MKMICEKKCKDCDVQGVSHNKPHDYQYNCSLPCNAADGNNYYCIHYDLEYRMKEIIKEEGNKKKRRNKNE